MRETDSGQDNAPPDFLAPAIAVKEAAWLAGVHTDTIARWCIRYGIGRQLHIHSPWAVDPVGLAVVVHKDAAALDAYQRRDTDNPALFRYIEACKAAKAFPAKGRAA
jgi:hypothetical protein